LKSFAGALFKPFGRIFFRLFSPKELGVMMGLVKINKNKAFHLRINKA